ncbi:MAG: sensor domain-containing protein [Bifidobacteriaceae bacterium]|nr:sensor domain-containing protein [Bifidobacteriaceae bacterium]
MSIDPETRVFSPSAQSTELGPVPNSTEPHTRGPAIELGPVPNSVDRHPRGPQPGALRVLRGYGRMWRRAGKNTVVLFTVGIMSVVSFTVLLALFCVSIGTIVIWLGLPALAGTLALAHLFAEAARRLARWRGDRIVDPAPLAAGPGGAAWTNRAWRWLKAEITSPVRWLELLHGVVSMVLGLSGLVLAVSWWAAALGEALVPVWVPIVERMEPGSVATVGDLLACSTGPSTCFDHSHGLIDAMIGLLLFALAPLVLEGWARLCALQARALLTPHGASARKRVLQLEAARTQAAAAETAALRSVERDLHDGPQQALIRVGMDLAAAERRLASGDAAAVQELIEQAKTRNSQALADLRALSRGIAPPTLAGRGLLAAVTVAAASSTVPVTLAGSVREGERFPEAAETAVYFAAAELLANAAKHAGACAIEVMLDQVDGSLVLTVRDDGRGGAQILPGHGLAGLADRLAGVDGSLTIADTVDGMGTTGTTARVMVPVGTVPVGTAPAG